MNSMWFPLWEFDLESLGLLPNGWLGELAEVAGFARATVLDGRSETSRETENSDPIAVGVVMGNVIRLRLPWLYNLYAGELANLAAEATGRLVYPSGDLDSSVNLNVLRGAGARYEWHVDSNPITGVLFGTTLLKGEGGELVFRDETRELGIFPTAGIFLIFDATKVPHRVEPLRTDKVRISVPMNFYYTPHEQPRPGSLNSYLYGEANPNGE